MKSNVLIRKFETLDELSKAAVKEFIGTAKQAIDKRNRFLVSISGGSTPIKLYKMLANENLDWSRVHFFWGDERCVPADDDGNNYGQAKKILFDRINIPPENIHRVNSELKPDEAAKEYTATLKQFADAPLEWPRFDLILLGMGDDGHTASLFPGSPVEVDKPVIAVTAHYQDRPANRVSFTQLVINNAREVFFLASGTSKAETLKRVLTEVNSSELPAQRIDPNEGRITWFVDNEAARLL